MPPRIPVVAVFVALYIAAVSGAGFDAINRFVDIWSAPLADWALGGLGLERPGPDAPEWLRRLWTGRLWLSLGDAFALGAAILALPDASWRPARRGVDRLVSCLVALGAGAAMALEPGMITPSFSVLAALAAGDAAASLGAFSRPNSTATS